MSKNTLKHAALFARIGHQPLTKSEKIPSMQWLQNQFSIDPAEVEVGTTVDTNTGMWRFVYKSRASGKSLTIAELQRLSFDKILQKYPRPLQGLARFLTKNSIPRGISNKHPFGDPSIRYFGYPTFNGMILKPMEREMIENWVKSFG